MKIKSITPVRVFGARATRMRLADGTELYLPVLQGAIVDTNRLNIDARNKLKQYLPKRFQDHRATAFLLAVSEGLWYYENVDGGEAHSLVRDTTDDVQKAVLKLQRALIGITASDPMLTSFECALIALTHQQNPTALLGAPNLETDGGLFLSDVLVKLDTLAAVAKLMHGNTNVSPQNQPSTEHAGKLARMVFRCWREHFNELPKKTTRLDGNAFTRFVRALGSRAKYGTPTPRLYPKKRLIIGHVVCAKAIDSEMSALAQQG